MVTIKFVEQNLHKYHYLSIAKLILPLESRYCLLCAVNVERPGARRGTPRRGRSRAVSAVAAPHDKAAFCSGESPHRSFTSDSAQNYIQMKVAAEGTCVYKTE